MVRMTEQHYNHLQWTAEGVHFFIKLCYCFLVTMPRQLLLPVGGRQTFAPSTAKLQEPACTTLRSTQQTACGLGGNSLQFTGTRQDMTCSISKAVVSICKWRWQESNLPDSASHSMAQALVVMHARFVSLPQQQITGVRVGGRHHKHDDKASNNPCACKC